MMEFIAGCHIFGLILIALAGQRTFTQDCQHPQVVTASACYDTPITSPNYPFNYSDNLECVWTIHIEEKPDFPFSGYVLKVIFSDFELQQSQDLSPISCPFDYLKFYDGLTHLSPLLGVGGYCGTVHPEAIYSTGNYLFVRFHTDSSSTFRGFSIGVSVVKAEETSGLCRKSNEEGSEFIVEGTSGTIFTPDYPVPYPDNITCIWTIYVPVGKRVKLKIVDFVLGKSVIDTSYNDFCKYHELANNMDFVEIHDGAWSGTKELGSYCGNRTSIDVYSSGRNMWVKFQAFPSGVRDRGKRGFKAHFEAVDLLFDKELCLPGNQNNLNLKLTGSHGTLQSPLDYYPVDLYCEWVITVPDGKIVELTFDRFELDVEGAHRCGDYVQVNDGRSTESGEIYSYCGSTIPAPVKSSGRYMRVRFQADNEFNKPHRGFKATFKAVDKSKTLALAVGITAGVIFVIVLACCVFYYVKRRKTPNEAAGAGIRMSAITTSASHTTQPGLGQHSPHPSPRSATHQQAGNPYSSPSVGYAPLPTSPQYPPPGQSYPWQQSSGTVLLPESS